MQLRALTADDHLSIVNVVDEWWGGRHVSPLLPRLFFEHFGNTSFVLEDGGAVRGFLIALLSQTQQDLVYVHFIGVDPRERGAGLGRRLYLALFERARELGRRRVRAITSPINHGSVKFHRHLGFALLQGDDVINGYPVLRDHGGPGEPRVCFEMWLDAPVDRSAASPREIEIGNET